MILIFSNTGSPLALLRNVLSALRFTMSADARFHASLVGLVATLTALVLQQRRMRNRITQDFRHSERKYHDLFENALDAIFEIDQQGNLLNLNPAGERLIGYSHIEFFGMNIARLVHPDHLEQLLNPDTSILFATAPTSRVLELRLIHRDGHTICVDVRAQLIQAANGSFVIQGIARDITDRKMMEVGREVHLQIARIQDETVWVSDMMPRALQAIGEGGEWEVCGFWEAGPEAGGDPAYVWPPSALDQILPHRPITTSENFSWHNHPGDAVQTVVQFPVRTGNKLFGWLVLLSSDRRLHSEVYASILADIAHDTALFYERAQEREALRSSEERFRSAFRDSAIGMAMVDRNSRMLQVNPSFCRMLGYSEEELLSLGDRDITHPDDFAVDMSLRNELLIGIRKKYELCKRYIHKDGHTVWGHLGISTLCDRNGRPAGFICQVVDESQRKRDEFALQRSEQRYRSLFERNLSGVIRCAPDGHILDCNDAFARLVGLRSRDEVIHKSLLDLCVDPEEFFRLIGLLRHRENVLNYEIHLHRWAGSEICGLASLSLFEKGDGVEDTIEGTIIDITERKQDEEELARLTRQMQLILNSAGEGICGLDRNSVITFVNPAAAALTGWEVEELLGANLHDFLHHSHADGTPVLRNECSVFASVADGSKHQTSDEIFWRKDGTNFPVELVSTPICSERGDILGAVVVFQDISQRRAIERMKNEFVSIVSHELRTPLTAIRGSLGLLTSERLGALSPQARHMLDIGISNTDRLIRLINNILDIERLDAGRIILQQQPCSVDALLSHAVATMMPLAEKAGLQVHIGACPATVHADPDRVEQTLTNLIGNAVKFSPRGASIRVSAEVIREEVRFAVQDHGRGIPADKLETIFERFEQVDASDSRKKGGSGLGLSIARSIVKQHGGRIWAESTPGAGSTFYFTLPCSPRLDAEQHSSTDTPADSSSAAASLR